MPLRADNRRIFDVRNSEQLPVIRVIRLRSQEAQHLALEVGDGPRIVVDLDVEVRVSRQGVECSLIGLVARHQISR